VSEQKTLRVDPAFELRPPGEPTSGLPAVIEHAPQPPRRRALGVTVMALVLLISGAVGIGWSWWRNHQMQLPADFAYGNGRLEADAIDIDTKFAGRIAKLLVDEGDIVTAGQVVAMMDTRDLEASLKKSQALVGQAERALEEAKANLTQQRTQVALA
jgi:HlyD family secretion protein